MQKLQAQSFVDMMEQLQGSRHLLKSSMALRPDDNKFVAEELDGLRKLVGNLIRDCEVLGTDFTKIAAQRFLSSIPKKGTRS